MKIKDSAINNCISCNLCPFRPRCAAQAERWQSEHIKVCPILRKSKKALNEKLTLDFFYSPYPYSVYNRIEFDELKKKIGGLDPADLN